MKHPNVEWCSVWMFHEMFGDIAIIADFFFNIRQNWH